MSYFFLVCLSGVPAFSLVLCVWFVSNQYVFSLVTFVLDLLQVTDFTALAFVLVS